MIGYILIALCLVNFASIILCANLYYRKLDNGIETQKIRISVNSIRDHSIPDLLEKIGDLTNYCHEIHDEIAKLKSDLAAYRAIRQSQPPKQDEEV